MKIIFKSDELETIKDVLVSYGVQCEELDNIIGDGIFEFDEDTAAEIFKEREFAFGSFKVNNDGDYELKIEPEFIKYISEIYGVALSSTVSCIKVIYCHFKVIVEPVITSFVEKWNDIIDKYDPRL